MGMPSSSPRYKGDPSLVCRTVNDAIVVFGYVRKEGCKVIYASISSIYNGNPAI
ncbi:MAG: hypothetical protein QW800_00505 [Candidatus Bathyarchaeia archaeon]